MSAKQLAGGQVVIQPQAGYWTTVAVPVAVPVDHHQWLDAEKEKPDADIAVLAVNAHHYAYWIATWDGQSWISVDTMQVVRITHWMDLPEAPRTEEASK